MPEEITVPVELRVEIKDERAADGITPDGMRAYLRDHRWHVEALAKGGAGERWALLPSARLQVFVPADGNAADVLSAIWRVSEVEGRPQLAVMADLRAASQEGDDRG